MKITRIIERKDVILYLRKRNLLGQYKKAKNLNVLIQNLDINTPFGV